MWTTLWNIGVDLQVAVGAGGSHAAPFPAQESRSVAAIPLSGAQAPGTPAAFSSATTSSSRWDSIRCRCGTVRRHPVSPKPMFPA